jgi:acetyltransferase-like isoleucine patch superfamily enzyme
MERGGGRRSGTAAVHLDPPSGTIAVLQVDTSDAQTLARYNIECAHIGNPSRNSIALPADIAPSGPLRLNVAGTGNQIEFHGPLLPAGTIHLIENHSCVTMSCKFQVNVELWMYDSSHFLLNEGFSIFGLHAWVYNGTTISIGKYCLMSEQVYMRTSDHHSIVDLETMQQINFPADIRLADQVWIGQGVTILKGVEIGRGSIIAACALVNCSVPETELWGGVPAKCLRKDVSWVPSHPANPYDVDLMARALGRSRQR